MATPSGGGHDQGSTEHLTGYLENEEWLSPNSGTFDVVIGNEAHTPPKGDGTGSLLHLQHDLALLQRPACRA